jgi:Na+/melibiose symporter-like transporter
MISVVFLFRPDADTTVTYFGIWALVFYLGYTMMNIPYIAWGAELSSDYRERSRIVTWRTVAGSFGGILFLAAPFLLPFDTTEMNAQVLAAVAWGTLVLVPVTVAITVLGVPSAPPLVAPPRTPILVLLRSVLGNKPFQRYLYVFILGAIQLGFYATLLLMFLDSYLGIGAKFSHIMAATAVISWLATPLWLSITNRWGKHRPWAWSLVGGSLGLLLFLFVEPGPGAFWPALVISCLCGALGACGAVAPPSILADIVEYDRWKSGEDRAGNYFAFHMMVVKLAVAVAGGFAFLVLDWFGFDPKETVHDATARLGMILAFVVVPNLLQLLSVIAIWNFPIDERAQRIVRRRLEQRDAREARKAKEVVR